MSVVDSNNLINLVAYKLLSKCRDLKSNENVIISPFSISLGLTSLAFGAKGKSRSDIATLLEVRSDCVTDEDLRALSSAFKDPGEGIKLANGLFADKTYPISESYCQILKKSLLPLESKPVDFVNQSVATLKEINKWVEAATNSMIKDFFTSDSINVDTRLVLVNAIHFKGIWEEAFDESATVKKPFHLSPSEEVAVDMMNVEKYFNFSQSPQLDCDCIELPYKQSSVSCYIFLPNKIDGLKVIDDNLSPALFKEIMERMSGNKRKISFSLPKFQIECEVDLKEVLTALGVVDIFQDGVADLSGFSEGGRALFVSKAIHKAVIEVNEEGTEAAAATGFAAAKLFRYVLNEKLVGPFGRRRFWGWLNDVANQVDPARIKEVGPDRAAAEWLIRCGASVKWKGTAKFHADYNSLPAGNFQSYQIEEIDGTESSIMSIGFPHLNGLTQVKVIKLIRCNYLDDPALPLLGFVKGTLEKLEVSSCGNISDVAIKSLDRLKNLKSLHMFDLQQVKNPKECLAHLQAALKDCQIQYPFNEK